MLACSKGLIFPFNTAYLSILFHLPNSGAQGSGAYHSCHSVKGRIQHGQVCLCEEAGVPGENIHDMHDLVYIGHFQKFGVEHRFILTSRGERIHQEVRR